MPVVVYSSDDDDVMIKYQSSVWLLVLFTTFSEVDHLLKVHPLASKRTVNCLKAGSA